jgi:hypothetical protein
VGAKPRIPDGQFIRLFEELGCAAMSRETGHTERKLYERRESLERKLRRQIVSPIRDGRATRTGREHPGRLHSDVDAGSVLVASDCHYWPGAPSLMHRAFVQFCKELKPTDIVLNGDVIDACTISKYPPIGWTHLPTVQDEIEAAQERVGEIEQAASHARKRWTMGNHDQRFEKELATKVPEYRKVKGTSLQDHFPLWEPCWDVWINNDVSIKHRFKGGINATRNNTLYGGKTMITGHLHAQQISPLTDYNGTRWGVDTGCIADPEHLAFIGYTENNPLNWRNGFCVLTFRSGRLLPPELVSRWDDDHVVWRGEVIKV